MRPSLLIPALLLFGVPSSMAQSATVPQSARQALLEMFTATTPGAFEKHLPEATRQALLKTHDSPLSMLRGFSSFGLAANARGTQLQTFETGSKLLGMEERNGLHKYEVIVERDDLLGDVDEIELSFRSYKNGKPEPLPVEPRLIFSMKQEKEIWKLNEITVAVHVKLADPEMLKGLLRTQNSSLESSAASNLRTLGVAEVTYLASYPERGYTCKLSELGGTLAHRQPSPQNAMFIDDVLASGKKSGYVYSISGCDIPPVSRFHITAVPADPESGMRAFCSDESGKVRYAADGKAATCLSAGLPLQ